MASIRKETVIDVRPDDAWAALRDFAAVHERLVPGFVTDCHLDADGARIVTFFTGAVAREVLVACDDENRRLVYSVVESPMGSTHSNASGQVFAEDDGRTRFLWITDVLPDAVAPAVDQLMEQGIGVIRQTLEAQAAVR